MLEALAFALIVNPAVALMGKLRNPSPRPDSPVEMEQLRAEAIQIVRVTRDDESLLETTEDQIENEEDLEVLRLYVRFIGKHEFYTIHGLVDILREGRTKCRTNLKSSDMTASHLDVYERFMEHGRVLSFSQQRTFQELTANSNTIQKTLHYTLNHMEQAERILKIMETRDIIDLKKIKPLLKVMDEVSSTPLSEGAL